MKCITVIVAVYNVEKYIEKCLRSICNQTYKNLEIIVVDDGSSDESGKLCDQMASTDERIRVVHKPNGGVSSARNAGLALATGEYVTFVDGDDYIDEEMYTSMAEQMSYGTFQMAICSFRYLYATKAKEEKMPLPRGGVSGKVFLDSLLKDAFGFYYSVVWNKLICRELLEKHNIRFDEQWNVMEDFRFTLQLLPYTEQIAVCDGAYYNYRKNNVGTATNRSIPFEESYRNRTQGYLWLKECLESCGCYEQNREKTVDYLIRYLASQFAKAVYSDNRKEQWRKHKEIRTSEFISLELQRVRKWYRWKRKIYWGITYLCEGMVQFVRRKVRKR